MGYRSIGVLKEHNILIVRFHVLIEICLTIISFALAYVTKKQWLPFPYAGLAVAPDYFTVLLLIIIIWYLVFNCFGLYESYQKQRFGQIIWNMVKAVCVSMAVLLICLFIFKITDISRILLGIFFIINTIFLGLSKATAYLLRNKLRKRDHDFHNILLVGGDVMMGEIKKAIQDDPQTGYRIIGCLETEKNIAKEKKHNDTPMIGAIDNLKNILLNNVVDEIILAVPLNEIKDFQSYLSIAEKLGVSVSIIIDLQIDEISQRPILNRIRIKSFVNKLIITIDSTMSDEQMKTIKSIIDYFVAGVVFVLVLPFFLLIAIAIKISSRGSVFFKQERCGLNGRKFSLYKFRTMAANAEEKRRDLDKANEAVGPVFKIRKDPRIIPVIGHFLRKTGIDELPQLINILKGEMSLVGPRPPIPAEVDMYDDWQRRKLSMKPGLTCIWQTKPQRNDINFDEWMRMDLEYIDKWTLSLDFKLIFKTFYVVFLGHGR